MSLLSKLTSRLTGAKPATARFPDMAEFRERVMAAVKRQPGVEQVAASSTDPAKFEMKIAGRSTTNDVTNIFGHLNAYPDEDADNAIARFVQATTEARPNTVSADSVFAVIRNQPYIDQLRSAGMDIFHDPLGADLVTVYMVDRPDSMSPISRKEMEGIDVLTLRAVAISNVRKQLGKIVSDGKLQLGVLYFVEGNTMLSTSLLLVDEFWASVQPRFPGDVLIALPRKDQLFLFDDGNPVAKDVARRLIDVTIKDNFNLLSHQLYARRNGRIVSVTD